MKVKIKGDLRCGVRFSTNQALTSEQSKKISDSLNKAIGEIMEENFDSSTSFCKVLTVRVCPDEDPRDL